MTVPETIHSLSGEPAFLKQFRTDSLENLQLTGFPNSKQEDWRFAKTEILFQENFETGIDHSVISYSHEVEPGVICCSLEDALKNHLPKLKTIYGQVAKEARNGFLDLNAAIGSSGVFIHLDKNVIAKNPMHIELGGSKTSQPRIVILLEEGSSLNLILEHQAGGWINSVSEIICKKNSRLNFISIQDGGKNSFITSQTEAEVSRDAVANFFTLSLDNIFVSNNLNLRFTESKGEAHLFGLTLLNGKNLCDNHTVVDHAFPNCFSNEFYKGIFQEDSTGVFNGKIFVRKDAQKTNAFQSNRNILLSDNATIHTKPQLEIFADDVKCTHGAAVGQLDEEALFYLRTRGLDDDSARGMLTLAFANDILEKIPVEEVKVKLESRIRTLLNFNS